MSGYINVHLYNNASCHLKPWWALNAVMRFTMGFLVLVTGPRGEIVLLGLVKKIGDGAVV